ALYEPVLPGQYRIALPRPAALVELRHLLLVALALCRSPILLEIREPVLEAAGMVQSLRRTMQSLGQRALHRLGRGRAYRQVQTRVERALPVQLQRQGRHARGIVIVRR